jgi:hypothetical protein
MTASRARRLALLACACVILVACGKKGPPRPPLSRIPAPIGSIAATRVGDDVFLNFRVPSTNLDSSTPVDIETVDVFALTTDQVPSRTSFLQHAKKIATLTVKESPATPAIPTAAASAAASPGGDTTPTPASARAADTVAPGEDVTIHETLAADAFVPVKLPQERPRQGAPAPPPAPESPPSASPTPSTVAAPAAPSAPAAASTSSSTPSSSSAAQGSGATAAVPPTPRRYYVAVASNSRQRSSPNGAQASVSIVMTPASPQAPTSTYDEQKATLTWDAVDGAASYNVYRDAAPAAAAADSTRAIRPAPINGVPLAVPTTTVPVEFGATVCYRVSALHREGPGELVESRPSDRGCVSAVDTFPPAPPTDVVVVAAGDGITVRWTANNEADLGGYVVLRGAPGDATLAPIQSLPKTATLYVDQNVMSGVRYVYAVEAVDTATPEPNRSLPSARDEATAR